MKLKLLFALVLINIGTVIAQEKLEVFFGFDKFDIIMATNQKLVDWVAASKNIEV
jgi:hypothetical protein